MNFPRYPEYKPSGVEWLGEVPAHWGLKRLKFAAACINDKQDVLPEGLEYVAMEHIESWTGKRLETENGVTPESQTSRFRRGDVLFGKLRPYLAKVWLADRDGVCSTELLVLRERDLEPAYLRYWTLMRSFVEVVDGSTYGSKMPRASWDFIGNVLSLIPERDEQRAIAAFLDRETARIDALIAKKQRLIELLAEKRTALISQAVTKGLNPDAPMKDSGVEWLGEIPAHWSVAALKREWTVLDCKHRTVTFTDDGLPVASIGEVLNFEIDLSNAKRTSREEYLEMIQGERKPRIGDIIYSRNVTVGLAAFVHTSQEFCMGQDVCLIRSHEQNARFLVSLLRSSVVLEQLETLMVGATFRRVNVEQIKSLLVCYPPVAEQVEIANRCERIRTSHDVLIARVSDAITKLQEFRTAMISAAVTGEIDVRGFAKQQEVA